MIEIFRIFRKFRKSLKKKIKNENERNIIELLIHYDVLCKVIVTCFAESYASLSTNFSINKEKL